MTEPSWPAPGVECICINSQGWPDLYNGPFGLILDYGNRPGPEFMKQYIIQDLKFVDYETDGHRLKLIFAEYPGYVHCACMFRPLVKIKDEETKDTTAPVDTVFS